MIMDKTKTILLDLDGTLLNIRNRHYIAYKITIESMGGKPLPLQEYWHLKRAKVSHNSLLIQSSVSEKCIDTFTRLFSETVENPEYFSLDEVFPWTKKTLQNLSDYATLRIISFRKNQQTITKQLTSFNLSGYISTVYSGSPNKYRTKYHLLPENLRDSVMAVAGDTEADIALAQKLTVPSYAVLSGIRNTTALKDYRPTQIIKNISYLPKYLYNHI
jgi:phosphoglycolate phosphatase-like HAD superfamily hydrolase